MTLTIQRQIHVCSMELLICTIVLILCTSLMFLAGNCLDTFSQIWQDLSITQCLNDELKQVWHGIITNIVKTRVKKVRL